MCWSTMPGTLGRLAQRGGNNDVQGIWSGERMMWAYYGLPTLCCCIASDRNVHDQWSRARVHGHDGVGHRS